MKTILLIEDNEALRDNASEILSLANYKVLTAGNGKTGIERAQREQPDLIVCDVMMPELDGYGVLHILKKKAQTANIPFIFLTAKTEKTEIRKGMNLGADDYLTKPFSDTDLLDAIETRLQKHEFRTKEYESTAEDLDRFLTDAGRVLNIEDLGKDKKVKHFKKKSQLFCEGDVLTHLFFLKSGSIKAFQSNPEGKELITNLYKAGDFFGFEPLLSNNVYQETAVALEDSESIVISRNDFLMLIDSHADISAAFISLLCKKVIEKEKQLLNLAYSSVRQRTADAILKVRLLKEGGDKINISRDDLAKIVGTASESVVRVLSDFKDEGLIEIESGKIIVLQSAKLETVVRWNVAR